MGKKSKFGPGFLVAAAFIGPGTVTTAALAGAKYGYSLIWVVVIATLSAIVLQEMVGRFSLSTKIDVASALVRLTKNKWLTHMNQPSIKILEEINHQNHQGGYFHLRHQDLLACR